MNNRPATPDMLPPATVAQLGNLQILAKLIVDGFQSGIHRSPRFGASTDFSEYRPYVPGDPLRDVDWKVLARADRIYVKKYEGDSNCHVVFLLDQSKSMDYQTDGLSKWNFISILAACLGLVATRQGDRIGWIGMANGIQSKGKPASGRGHFNKFLAYLDTVAPAGTTDLPEDIDRVAQLIYGRGIVVLLSDFYGPTKAMLQSLRHLRARGQDLILFHVLDQREIDLTFTDGLMLTDMETGKRMTIDPEVQRPRYQAKLSKNRQMLQTFAREADAEYIHCSTEEPIGPLLYHFLHRRQKSL